MKKQSAAELPDDDNPQWNEADIAQAMSFSALPESLRGKLSANRRGPQRTPTKERITIRLSRNVVESFRATGAGWQTRMDIALQEWLRTHPPG